MALMPADPYQAVLTLAQAVDRLNGQVAALTAYIAASQRAPLDDAAIEAVKSLIPSLAQPTLGVDAGVSVDAALRALDDIQRLVAQIATSR